MKECEKQTGIFRTENSRMQAFISWPRVGWLDEINIGQIIHGMQSFGSSYKFVAFLLPFCGHCKSPVYVLCFQWQITLWKQSENKCSSLIHKPFCRSVFCHLQNIYVLRKKEEGIFVFSLDWDDEPVLAISARGNEGFHRKLCSTAFCLFIHQK